MALDKKYSVAEWAKLRGITPPAAKKCAERHHIEFDEDGKAFELDWLKATLDGKLKDKSLISSHTPSTIDPFKAKKIEKLDREITKLDIAIDHLRGRLIPVDDFRNTLLSHCQFVDNLCKLILNEISLKFRDSEIVQTVNECINRALEEEQENVKLEIEKLEKNESTRETDMVGEEDGDEEEEEDLEKEDDEEDE